MTDASKHTATHAFTIPFTQSIAASHRRLAAFVLLAAALMLLATPAAYGQQDRVVFDDFESYTDGNLTPPYFTFDGDGGDGGNDGVTLSTTSDTPDENGGSIALSAAVDESEVDGFYGFGAPITTDASSLDDNSNGELRDDDAFFNFYLKSDNPGTETNAAGNDILEVNLIDGDGERFQATVTLENTGGEYQLVSIPLASFAGGGTLSPTINQVEFAVGGGTIGTETYTVQMDYIAFSSPTAIPVELTHFGAVAHGGTAVLRWETASEINNEGFEIQQSVESGDFQVIGFEPGAGAGTTTEARQYAFLVPNLEPGTYRFRLRQVDLGDQGESFSDVVTVEIGATEAFTLLEAPASPMRGGTSGTLRFAVQQSQPVQVALYNVLGQRVQMLYDGNASAGSVTNVQIDGARLSSGTYFVRVQGRTFVESERVVMVR